MDLADFSREEVVDLLALAQSLQERARGKDSRLGVSESLIANARIISSRHVAARR
jgi:hypothetical protein